MPFEPTQASKEFVTIAPKILYFGTPVAIVSSANEDGTTNLAPISSFWALGWTMVLGLLRDTKTLENLERSADCVVNLPSPEMWRQVEKLAPLTGLNPVPAEKAAKFRHTNDKFTAADLTAVASECVQAARVGECPAQLEGRVSKIHRLAGEEKLNALTGGSVYNFRHYFGLGEELGKTFRSET